MSRKPHAVPGNAAVDPATLRSRYAAERETRLRSDGNDQYVPVEGNFARYGDDPYAKPGFTRAPLNEAIDVAVIGGGFSGLLTAGRLKQAGVGSIRIIERGSDFGGTWYWNRYPGAACDVESYIYLPLLEELGYMPSEKYTKQPEIWAYTRSIAEKFGLYDSALLQTDVSEIRWDEADARWVIRTSRDDTIRARHVCLCTGTYARPKLPGIPGIENFAGDSFHTCRWDYGYTGGEKDGALTKLKNKRVGLIGTGATAIQVVPHLGKWAKHLYVFQRTPSSVGWRGNRPTDPEWAKSLEPGWQKRRMENFHAITTGVRVEEDLIADAWSQAAAALSDPARIGIDPASASNPMELRQLADYAVMDGVRRRVGEIVKDPETAEALKPWYNFMCKRPCFHDDYLETFNRANVTLVDTKGKGVEAIDSNAVIVDGQRFEVDLLIYATGFEQNAPSDRAGDFTLVGRNGATLSETWAEGPRTLHGIATHGFPNLFIVGGMSQAGGGVNFPYALTEQSLHVATVIARCVASGVRTIEATEVAVAGWANTIEEKAPPIRAFLEQCTPGYFNQEGKVKGAFFLHLYGGGLQEYFDVLAEWRASGFERDMDISYADARAEA